jgi:hypothetical protein
MKDGKIHRAIILEEFTHSTPKPGDPVRYKGDDDYKIVTIIENSAWITKDGVSSLKASPGEWEAVRAPKRGDWIMVSRNGEKYKPRLFFAYTYDKSGVFAIDDEICWSRWRFMTSEVLPYIFE